VVGVTETHIVRPGDSAPTPAIEKWNDLCPRHTAAMKHWWNVLEQTGSFLKGQSANLLALTNGLLVAGYTARMLSSMRSELMDSAQEKAARATRFREYAAEYSKLLEEGKIPGGAAGREAYYGLLDYGSETARDAGVDAAAAAHPTLPKGVGAAGDLLGNLALGYGIYADIRDGESVPQAVTSESGGMLAGMLAGGEAGGAIGSMGFPVVGTIIGAIVGGLVGISTNMLIDDLWPHHDHKTVALSGEEAAHQQASIEGLLSTYGSTAPRELIMSHDDMKRAEGKLMLAGQTFDSEGRRSPHGQYGDAQSLVELLIGIHEEAAAALAEEPRLIGVAVGMCSADGQRTDADTAFTMLSMTKTT